MNDYRQEEQRVVDRKEFDLNDPDAKKKDLPARVCLCVCSACVVCTHRGLRP